MEDRKPGDRVAILVHRPWRPSRGPLGLLVPESKRSGTYVVDFSTEDTPGIGDLVILEMTRRTTLWSNSPVWKIVTE